MKKAIRKKTQKLSAQYKTLLIMLLLALLWWTHSFVFFLIMGMLPSLVLLLTDRNDSNKFTVITLFNIAGCIPYIFHMILNDFSYNALIGISTKMLTWFVMYGCAALGLFVYYFVPSLFGGAVHWFHQFRINQIEKELAKIKKEWGEI